MQTAPIPLNEKERLESLYKLIFFDTPTKECYRRGSNVFTMKSDASGLGFFIAKILLNHTVGRLALKVLKEQVVLFGLSYQLNNY